MECDLQHRAVLHAPAAEAPCRCCACARQVQQGTKDDHHETRYDAFEPLQGVFALGDCCANVKTPLPSLAQANMRFLHLCIASCACEEPPCLHAPHTLRGEASSSVHAMGPACMPHTPCMERPCTGAVWGALA
jgi:hypothetical protein